VIRVPAGRVQRQVKLEDGLDPGLQQPAQERLGDSPAGRGSQNQPGNTQGLQLGQPGFQIALAEMAGIWIIVKTKASILGGRGR
jgi:hypothetical protein